MTAHFGVQVEEIFNTMPARFRPEGAEGLDIAIGYVIQGEGSWKLTVKDRTLSVEKTEDLSGCGLQALTDGRTFVGVNLGKVDAMEAWSSRKLVVKGDMALFGRTGRLFKKYVIPGAETVQEQELLVLKKTISVQQRFATGPVMGKFLKALKEKKILAIKCPSCGRLQSPPREICAVCRVRNRDWVEIGPKGTMRMLEYCYYASPDPLTGETRETPYGAIGVLLDGCKGSEVFWHLLRPDQLDRVEIGIVLGEKEKIGTRLRPVWRETRTGSVEDITYFEIDE